MRWNAYMRTEGFQCCDERVYERVFRETKKDQHQLARLHICLAPFDELPHVDKWDACAQKSSLTDKARAKGLVRLFNLVIKRAAHDVPRENRLDDDAAKVLEGVIREMAKGELDLSEDVAVQIVNHLRNQLASDNGDLYVRLLSAIDVCARQIIDEGKRNKPFQHNDLAIIRNPRSIVCGT